MLSKKQKEEVQKMKEEISDTLDNTIEKRYIVTMKRVVKVSVDKRILNDEFIEKFRNECFELDGVEEHMKYLAQKCAMVNADNAGTKNVFIDGYGNLKEIGIRVCLLGLETIGIDESDEIL